MIEPAALGRLQRLDDVLSRISSRDLARLLDRDRNYPIVDDEQFNRWSDDKYGCFAAPFDWINPTAEIVLIGITPGMKQASQALTAFAERRRVGAPLEDAAARAKEKASFAGSMRAIAAQLMDRFRLNALFGLKSSADLFGVFGHRAHYTSILRYPVLQRNAAGAQWKDFSGGDDVLRHSRMRDMIEELFVPEIKLFPSAWLVPFGPTPASVLAKLSADGVVDPQRVLPGMNHPSGTQWNRHNCQLKMKGESHADCARNVGCAQLKERTSQLESLVLTKLANAGGLLPIDDQRRM